MLRIVLLVMAILIALAAATLLIGGMATLAVYIAANGYLSPVGAIAVLVLLTMIAAAIIVMSLVLTGMALARQFTPNTPSIPWLQQATLATASVITAWLTGIILTGVGSKLIAVYVFPFIWGGVILAVGIALAIGAVCMGVTYVIPGRNRRWIIAFTMVVTLLFFMSSASNYLRRDYYNASDGKVKFWITPSTNKVWWTKPAGLKYDPETGEEIIKGNVASVAKVKASAGISLPKFPDISGLWSNWGERKEDSAKNERKEVILGPSPQTIAQCKKGDVVYYQASGRFYAIMNNGSKKLFEQPAGQEWKFTVLADGPVTIGAEEEVKFSFVVR